MEGSLRPGVVVKIAKKEYGSTGRRRKADITGILAGLDVSPARFIRQTQVEKKIICPNYNIISEKLIGISWITIQWFSDGVVVVEKKGKLSTFIRLVIGWVILLKIKRRKFKKND